MQIENKKMLKRSNACTFIRQDITFNDTLCKYNIPNKFESRSRLAIYVKEDELLNDESTQISSFPLLYVSSDTTIPTNIDPLHSTSISSSVTSSSIDNITELVEQDEHDFTEKELYACCLTYDAEHEGDLSIKFSDRVYLIKELNEYALVKHMQTFKYGYVPKACLIKVKQFLSLLSV